MKWLLEVVGNVLCFEFWKGKRKDNVDVNLRRMGFPNTSVHIPTTGATRSMLGCGIEAHGAFCLFDSLFLTGNHTLYYLT
jgi:hypothetical protein